MSKCLFENNYISEMALFLVCPEQNVIALIRCYGINISKSKSTVK